MTEPVPGEYAEHEEAIVEQPDGRGRAVNAVNTLIRFVTGLFALVLVLHIVLVLAEANFGNAFASFVADFAGAVTLGLSNLFTFASEKAQLAANEGLAAILWLIIGAALTALIARVLLPNRTRIVRRHLRS